MSNVIAKGISSKLSEAEKLSVRNNIGLGIGSGFGRKNLVINGGFDVQQRGGSTGVVPVNAYGYVVDRWWGQSFIGDTGTGDANVVAGFYYPNIVGVKNACSFSLQSTEAMPTNGVKRVVHLIEDVRNLSGQIGTLSFYASSTDVTSMYVVVRQESEPGVVINEVIAEEVTLNITLEKKEITMDFPSVFGEVLQPNSCISITFLVAKKDNTTFTVPNGEYGNTGVANLELSLTNVQLELGSQATDFEYRSIGEELALCQRYYEVVPQFYNYMPYVSSIQFQAQTYCYKVQKRVAPTVNISADGVANIVKVSDAPSYSSAVIVQGGEKRVTVIETGSGLNRNYVAFAATADAEL